MLDPQAMKQTFENIEPGQRMLYVNNCVQLLVGLSAQVPEIANVLNVEAATAALQQPLDAGQRTLGHFWPAAASATPGGGGAIAAGGSGFPAAEGECQDL